VITTIKSQFRSRRPFHNLPADFRYRDTIWYDQVSHEYQRYRMLIFIASLFVGMMVPVILFLFNPQGAISKNLHWNYLAAFLTLFLLFLISLISRITRFVMRLAPLISIVGWFASVFLPGGGDVHWLIIFIFPILYFQLLSIREAIIWFLIFYASIAITFLLFHNAWIVHWPHSINRPEGFLLIITSLLIALLSFAARLLINANLQRLVHSIIYDPVTKLPNNEVLLYSVEPSESYMLAILRIENFQDLGNLFGFEMSDDVLKFAGESFFGVAKPLSLLPYHLGKNDFAVLMKLAPNQSLRNEGKEALRRLLMQLRKKPLVWQNMKIYFQIRAGASSIIQGEVKQALSQANTALLSAIRSFSEYKIFADFEQEKLYSLNAILRFSNLVENIEQKKLEAFFQPIVDIQTGQIIWYEGLMRLKRTNGTYEPVGPYLHIARGTGYYEKFSSLIIEKIVQAMRLLPYDFSMNISFLDITNPVLLEQLRLQKELVPGFKNRLILEIIETEDLHEDVLENPTGKIFFQEMKKIGIRLALDDFGSGFSNLSKILQMPIQIIKIDGSLIKRVSYDKNAERILEGMLSFCEKNGLTMVAEYVENEKSCQILKNLKVHYGQGYYFGKPIPLEEIRLPDRGF